MIQSELTFNRGEDINHFPLITKYESMDIFIGFKNSLQGNDIPFNCDTSCEIMEIISILVESRHNYSIFVTSANV
jgi:hypothetical protein